MMIIAVSSVVLSYVDFFLILGMRNRISSYLPFLPARWVYKSLSPSPQNLLSPLSTAFHAHLKWQPDRTMWFGVSVAQKKLRNVTYVRRLFPCVDEGTLLFQRRLQTRPCLIHSMIAWKCLELMINTTNLQLSLIIRDPNDLISLIQ